MTSQPPWRTQQCWLVLWSEDAHNLCPGHPTPCREKRPYLTSGQQYFNRLQRKTDLSVVEGKVRWKILAYYSYESYQVQTLLITLGDLLFSCHISHFYLKCLKCQKCVWTPASQALLPLCQLLVARNDNNN